MYVSSSGESKYSERDRTCNDHLLKSSEALNNSLRKWQNADKIVQKNEMNNCSYETSHLVTYFNEIRNKCQAPKGLGLIHRMNEID